MTANLPFKNFKIPLMLLLLGFNAPAVLAQSAPAQSDASSALTIRADVQEANAKTGIVTAKGNVRMNYPARQIKATSAQAQYFSQERRIVLSGNVVVFQQGNSIKAETITYLIDEGKFQAQPQSNQQVESVYVVTDSNSAPIASTTPVKDIKPAFKSTISPAIPATPIKTTQPVIAPTAPNGSPSAKPSPKPSP